MQFFRTFVIEKQPPQVMKTNTRFMATVRLLVSQIMFEVFFNTNKLSVVQVGGVLNVHMEAPPVHVSIISESQANELISRSSTNVSRRLNLSSGDILNGQGTMDCNSATKQVSVQFRYVKYYCPYVMNFPKKL